MKTTRSHRGAAVAALVLLLCGLQMLAVLGMGGSAQDSEIVLRRVIAARVQYAADAGALIAARQIREQRAVPTSDLTLGDSRISFVLNTVSSGAGDLVVRASTDNASRRIRVTLAPSGN